jgi:hypothetical protein
MFTSFRSHPLQPLLAAALKSLEGATRWEHRHGICFAIGRFANPQASLVKYARPLDALPPRKKQLRDREKIEGDRESHREIE